MLYKTSISKVTGITKDPFMPKRRARVHLLHLLQQAVVERICLSFEDAYEANALLRLLWDTHVELNQGRNRAFLWLGCGVSKGIYTVQLVRLQASIL